MSSNVDPSVSLLISNVRNLHKSIQLNRLEDEKKIIAQRELKKIGSQCQNIWKKLYLQLRGIDVDEMDFVKASAAKELSTKRCCYLGLIYNENPKHTIMLLNTLRNDLNADQSLNDVLILLCNLNDREHKLIDIADLLKPVMESNKLYTKTLVAKTKYSEKLSFSMVSAKEIVLLSKIQIVLDHNLSSQLTENDRLYLKTQIFSLKCPFTKLKLVQLFLVLVKNHNFLLNEKIILFLKDAIISFDSKTKKQIEIALTIEIANLLVQSNNMCDKVDLFFFRMVNSENPNSRYLAFKFIAEHNILSEIAIDRLITLGVDLHFHVETLKRLINKNNYKSIYKRREEITHFILKDRVDFKKSDSLLLEIYERISEFADFEFVCKMIYTNPKLYKRIRNKNVIISDQSKSLFKKLMEKDEIEYFPIIYDIMPKKFKDDSTVSSLAFRHLNTLTGGGITDEKICLLDDLFDVLCSHGNIVYNRILVLETYKTALFENKSPIMINKLLEGILLFNLVLDEKYFHVSNSVFFEYVMKDHYVEIKFDKQEIQAIESLENDLKACEPTANSCCDLAFVFKDYIAYNIKIKTYDESFIKMMKMI
jgi:hypothetical protein